MIWNALTTGLPRAARLLALLAEATGEVPMGTITVRNLDDAVQQRLRERAAAHGRSMEAEARAILTSAVGRADFVRDWLDIAVEYGGVELSEPSRNAPRQVDL